MDNGWNRKRVSGWKSKPAKDEVIGLIPETTKEEIDLTVRAAQQAFWSWRTTPPLDGRSYFLIFMRNLTNI